MGLRSARCTFSMMAYSSEVLSSTSTTITVTSCTWSTRRAPAPLAGDDFIRRGLIGHRPHQDRLHDAALADRPGQGFDLICFEVLARIARIARIGAQELNRDLALPQLSLGRRLVVI